MEKGAGSAHPEASLADICRIPKIQSMKHTISSTELARRLGDVLGRVRYLGDTFVIERNGDPVARLGPLPGASPVTLREALRAWTEAGPPDPDFADALEQVGGADRPPEDPWGS
jgi:antitoxin (DNA-binding transcriptional repressor) of toxin-antitoxin stability system